ncbi:MULTISPECIES: hypothetical protein [Bacillus]|uniref:hypothetical protein n=1 Tax=Bacillus TaxID=1386 RepID=UPI000534E4F5|nr:MULTISPECIES: hypothetical protein [Bacillus]MEB9335663.1 hypothetical protein [Bacillus cereus]
MQTVINKKVYHIIYTLSLHLAKNTDLKKFNYMLHRKKRRFKLLNLKLEEEWGQNIKLKLHA